mgnify:CR=1 FL=1
MKKISLLMLALLGILVFISSCGQSQSPAIDAKEALPDLMSQKNYELNCLTCHGAERQGISELGPALTPQSLAELSDTETGDTILNGRPGTAMIGFKDRLNQGEIDALIQFIKYTSPMP